MAVRRRVEEEWQDDEGLDPGVEHAVVEERVGLSPAMRIRNLLMSLVGAAVTVVVALLGVRVLMLLVDANSNSSFASLIYDLTDPLVAPFDGIAADRTAGGGVVEVSTLVAMGAYVVGAVLAILVLGAMFSWTDGQERTVAERRVRE